MRGPRTRILAIVGVKQDERKRVATNSARLLSCHHARINTDHSSSVPCGGCTANANTLRSPLSPFPPELLELIGLHLAMHPPNLGPLLRIAGAKFTSCTETDTRTLEPTTHAMNTKVGTLAHCAHTLTI
ncbi:hypothetical protein B0H13DRAFT_2304133 [Mycena leptocephala]|nr:hypothetical protein B0H13DRAFT_2304133 [Mycena leptocephala]